MEKEALRIAIIDDENTNIEKEKGFLTQFGSEKGYLFQIDIDAQSPIKGIVLIQQFFHDIHIGTTENELQMAVHGIGVNHILEDAVTLEHLFPEIRIFVYD